MEIKQAATAFAFKDSNEKTGDESFSMRKKGGEYAKKACKGFLMHIGLAILVMLYCLGGVYLFQYLEASGERTKKEYMINCSREVENMRRKAGDDLWEQRGSPKYNETVTIIIQNYHANVTNCIASGNLYKGMPLNTTDVVYGWSFASAFLFTITIVTTIGYGHITPVTAPGQLTVIFYALVGIPLMLMFLANIGDLMARAFRNAYGYGCCYFCRKRRIKNYEMNRKAVRDFQRKPRDAWTKAEREQMADVERWLAEREASGALIMMELEVPEDDTINVPISLTLVVIAAYVFLGAVIFAAWDGWSWITGAYFSFVTLATIGFGDYVPGYSEAQTTAGSMKLAGSCLYIILGLAVLSMSFNLMMEEMIAKFRWLGRKLGIIDDPIALNRQNLNANANAGLIRNEVPPANDTPKFAQKPEPLDSAKFPRNAFDNSGRK